MEREASMFEPSEMLSSFLASTPLLMESWRFSCLAAPGTTSFVADHIGDDTSYVAFSGLGISPGIIGRSCGNLAPLETVANGIFSGLRRDQADPPMVHAGFLHLFLSVYNDPNFQSQIMEIMSKSKCIVLTGHSVGGAIASLATLWLLSYLQTISSPKLSVMCITFGSPMLGTHSLCQSILQERWGGNFCHVVSQHDIVPSLPLSINFPDSPLHLSDEYKVEVFRAVLVSLEKLSKGHQCESLYRPFGSYFFCTSMGAICVDNSTAILKLLYFMLTKSSPTSSFDDHFKYKDYIDKMNWQFLERRNSLEENLSESSFEAGIMLALQSSGISSHEPNSGEAKECLKMAKKLGRTRNLNSANLAIGLSKINPLRAQIEWYKQLCEDSDDQLGYYDAFKLRGASRKDFKVNMNRIKLGQFWDSLIEKLETNQLPHDFNNREKWVYGSHFYKLLVEPLEIAEYYKTEMHLKKGHYLENGRERRFKIFDKWWNDKKAEPGRNTRRSKFASATQDSCFWARVEEARDRLNKVRSEADSSRRYMLLENIDNFDKYAMRIIDEKEVSKDVLATNSSYSLFVREWRELKSQLQLLLPQYLS
nr:lipase-like PAD4 [Ipomoea batatas]